MRVFYINLKKRQERDERFRRHNEGLADFRRIDAIEGAALRTEDLIREGVIAEPLRAYTAGALGCACSHKKLWELCAESGEPTTIAEDDAVFNRHFAQKAPALLQKLPAGWDYVTWGWNFDSILHAEVIPGLKQTVMNFDFDPLGPKTADFQQLDHDVVGLRLFGAFGQVCYTVSPQGAQHLLASCFPLRNEVIPVFGLQKKLFNFSLDTVMNKYLGKLQSYVCFPPLVWTENDRQTSDVRRR